MKNWEFYEDKIRAYEARFAVVNGRVECCSNGLCTGCAFDNDDDSCWDKRLEFLYQEHKELVVLTDDEKVLCRLLGRGWIARDEDKSLWWFEGKPEKQEAQWAKGKGTVWVLCLSLFFPQCKFDFIKWEDKEPWEVQVDD